MISGLQHIAFCRRQWALIHIEQLWQENIHTVDGALMHKKAHDKGATESRGNLLITRGMAVFSHRLGLTGQCDVLEFHKADEGIELSGQGGRWRAVPVEYKRGEPKENDCDRLQLCAQAMCLEEMLCCNIPKGALYYGKTRHREVVEFSDELRSQVELFAQTMHDLFRRRHTPKVKAGKHCNACSLKDQCLPKLMESRSVADYLQERMGDET